MSVPIEWLYHLDDYHLAEYYMKDLKIVKFNDDKWYYKLNDGYWCQCRYRKTAIAGAQRENRHLNDILYPDFPPTASSNTCYMDLLHYDILQIIWAMYLHNFIITNYTIYYTRIRSPLKLCDKFNEIAMDLWPDGQVYYKLNDQTGNNSYGIINLKIKRFFNKPYRFIWDIMEIFATKKQMSKYLYQVFSRSNSCCVDNYTSLGDVIIQF